MAVIYLRSTDGSDASDGLTWANAKATLAAALTAAGAGGTVYVSDAHAETQASAMTLTSPGTADSPVTVLCVDDTGDPEPPTALATTATISTTGASSITLGAGYTFGYGFKLQAGSAANSASILSQTTGTFWSLSNCGLTLNNTSVASLIRVGAGSIVHRLILMDCTLTFGAAGQAFRVDGSRVRIAGGSVAGTAPTTLINGGTATQTSTIELVGVDLSLLGSGNNIFGQVSKNTAVDCKLGSSVTLCSASFTTRDDGQTTFINSDSADTNYRYYSKNYEGEVFHETTIVRTGGASDGTTPISRKMTSSANSKFYAPLIASPITAWNDTSGSSKTITVEIISFGAAKLTDAETWITVEYLGTSGFPIASFSNDRAADILATPADQATSTATWIGSDRQNSTAYSLDDIIEVQGRLWVCTTAGTTAGSEPGGYATGADGDSVTDNTAVFRAGWRQKISKAVTPQEKGPFRAYPVLAKASTTIYFCPKADVT